MSLLANNILKGRNKMNKLKVIIRQTYTTTSDTDQPVCSEMVFDADKLTTLPSIGDQIYVAADLAEEVNFFVVEGLDSAIELSPESPDAYRSDINGMVIYRASGMDTGKNEIHLIVQ